jgi:hypothetical protein
VDVVIYDFDRLSEDRLSKDRLSEVYSMPEFGVYVMGYVPAFASVRIVAKLVIRR